MKHVLLAEDDPVNRAFLSDALTLLGWQVVAIADGESAIQAGIAQRFDVLLLDLNLPDQSALDILRQIRNRDEHASADTPALVLTATHDAAVHQKLRQQGVEATATKPISVQQLKEAIESLAAVPVADRDGIAEDHAPFSATTPVWDDPSALKVTGNNPTILASLRQLLLADLPKQRNTILSDPASAEARKELHRLRAACGFCGAALLQQGVLFLERARSAEEIDHARQLFAQAVEESLATLPP